MYSEQIAKDIRNILDEHRMEFEFNEKLGVFAIDIRLKTINIRACIFIVLSEEYVKALVQSVLTADKSNKSRVAEFLHMVNNNNEKGNYEFDKEQGTIRYICSLNITNIKPTSEMLQETIFMAEAGFDKYASALREVMEGTSLPEEAMKKAVMEF